MKNIQIWISFTNFFFNITERPSILESGLPAFGTYYTILGCRQQKELKTTGTNVYSMHS
jgi:hypothetical protein